MLDTHWQHWGASVRGPLHIRENLPNQDAFVTRQYSWGHVIAVSDGLGSRQHSDVGARAACNAVLAVARTMARTRRIRIHDALRLLHANWLFALEGYSPYDCAATCLFAIQRPDFILLGQLGDGAVICNGTEVINDICLIADRELAFSNQTESLTERFDLKPWKVQTIPTEDYDSVFLCTDGISDDLLPSQYHAFSRNLLQTYQAVSPQRRTADISRWLTQWPVPGHSDDKTFACLLKYGEFPR